MPICYLKVKTLIGKEWDLEWGTCMNSDGAESLEPLSFSEPPLPPAVTEETGFPLFQGPVRASPTLVAVKKEA